LYQLHYNFIDQRAEGIGLAVLWHRTQPLSSRGETFRDTGDLLATGFEQIDVVIQSNPSITECILNGIQFAVLFDSNLQFISIRIPVEISFFRTRKDNPLRVLTSILDLVPENYCTTGDPFTSVHGTLSTRLLTSGDVGCCTGGHRRQLDLAPGVWCQLISPSPHFPSWIGALSADRPEKGDHLADLHHHSSVCFSAWRS